VRVPSSGSGRQVGCGRDDLLRRASGFISVMGEHGLCQDLCEGGLSAVGHDLEGVFPEFFAEGGAVAFAVKDEGEAREVGGGSFEAEFFASPLHGDDRHAEGLGDLALRRAAVGDELAGEKAERGDVLDGMGEDREVAIEVIYLAVALLESEFASEGGAADGKDGKLDLRHGLRMDAAGWKRQHGVIDFPRSGLSAHR